MKVSINWLKELVDLRVTIDEIIRLLPLRTIATKEVTIDFIELDMKGYNRADLLSLRGVAYEVAAITDSKLNFSEEKPEDILKELEKNSQLEVLVENPELNPIYLLVKIEGLKVGESASEWKQKLEDSGIRSVNNIADITNLVMLEFGQPLHSFDASKVQDQKVIVRTARKGEKITTLDGKERDLEESDLLITDSEKAIGIAGVMGGENTEVTNSTTSILLEAAIFDPINLRKTATRLGLISEASKRFQHGLTKTRLVQALNTAIKMYQSLGGKVSGFSIVGDYQDKQSKVTLTQAKTNSLIGVEIKPDQVEDYLRKLHFEISSRSRSNNNYSSNEVRSSIDQSWEITPPYWRLDIGMEEDLIEEVARMYGYEKIPAKELKGELAQKIDQTNFELIKRLKLKLVELGLTEVQTYPYYSTAVLENLGWHEQSLQHPNQKNTDYLVKIANPISKETEYLRQDIWPNLVEATINNLKYFSDVAIFEIGKIYKGSKKGLIEEYRLSIALSNETDDPLQELHQIFQQLIKGLKYELELKSKEPEGIAKSLFHPKRLISFLKKDEQVGGMGEVHPRIVNNFSSDKRIAILELTLKN